MEITPHQMDGEKSKGNGKDPGIGLIIKLASEYTPRKIAWLWDQRIALGKFSLFAGDPGIGKSMATVAITAAVTVGAPWPCGEGSAPLGEVLILSAEDDAEDTIVPRLISAGADLTKVHIIETLMDIDADGVPYHRAFSLKTDLPMIETHLQANPNISVVFIDPVGAFTGDVESHRDAAVRSLLTPLGKTASTYRVAIIGIAHLNKGAGASAIYRVVGSIGLVGAARVVYGVMLDPDDNSRRLVLPIKNNLGDDNTGLAYQIGVDENGVPRVEWENEIVAMKADDIMNGSREENMDISQKDRAKVMLVSMLSRGPVLQEDIKAESEKHNLGYRTVESAKRELEILSVKRFDRQWEWSLPEETYRLVKCFAKDS